MIERARKGRLFSPTRIEHSDIFEKAKEQLQENESSLNPLSQVGEDDSLTLNILKAKQLLSKQSAPAGPLPGAPGNFGTGASLLMCPQQSTPASGAPRDGGNHLLLPQAVPLLASPLLSSSNGVGLPSNSTAGVTAGGTYAANTHTAGATDHNIPNNPPILLQHNRLLQNVSTDFDEVQS